MNKYLTVKDVMEKLKEFPEDMEIYFNDHAYGIDSFSFINMIHSYTYICRNNEGSNKGRAIMIEGGAYAGDLKFPYFSKEDK